jgi:transposase
MAYRNGQDREQVILFPESIDDYIPETHVVRAYDAFVDTLDLSEMGIELNPQKVGNSQYNPRLMLKLLLFGYSYGISSSRKLERETYNNLAFIWLMKNLKPDHKTIAEFRRRNKDGLVKVLRLCARLCLKLDLVEGNVLFADGTKIQANAGRKHQHLRKWYDKQLKEVDRRIHNLITESEDVDRAESGQGSWVKMPEEYVKETYLKETIENALKKLAENGTHTKNGNERTVNRIDPESAMMKNHNGVFPGYNVQSVVDDAHGLIVSIDAVNDANDARQFSRQIQSAEDNLGKKCSAACADAGYANVEEFHEIESESTTVIVPSKKQMSKADAKPFEKDKFSYDASRDCYICPEGHTLIFRRFQNKKLTKRDYRIEKAEQCRDCQFFGVCTDSRHGRTIVRHVYDDLKETIEQRFDIEEYRNIYERRKSRVELPFGYIKKILGFRQLGLRGLSGARAEASLVATCFNVTRMIALLGGVKGFINKVQTAEV